MTKQIIRKLALGLALFMSAVCVAPAALAALPEKPKNANTYVFDYTSDGVMQSADVLRMDVAAEALQAETKAEAVCVMVDFLDGEDVDTYARDLMDAWGIGDKKRNDGLLLLFSRGDHEIAFAVGKGLEKSFPAATRGQMIDDYALDALKQNNFSEGLRTLFVAVCQKMAQNQGKTLALGATDQGYRDYNTDQTQNNAGYNYSYDYNDSNGYGHSNYGNYGSYNYSSSANSRNGGGSFLGTIITIIVIWSILKAIFRPRRYATGGGGGGGGCLSWLLLGSLLNNRPRNYGNTYGPRSPMPPFGGFGNPFGSGGPFGGNSRGGGSSSGRSGGGFRGGGGSSGGSTSRKF